MRTARIPRVLALPGGRSLLWRPRTILVCGAMTLVLLGVAVAGISLGTTVLTATEVVQGLFQVAPDPWTNRVVGIIRLPRVLAAILVGASLGTAGAVFQSLARNPLGSPDIVGFTTGSALGAVLLIVAFSAGQWLVAGGAILGGLVCAALVYLLSLRGGRSSPQRLVMAGIGVSATAGGIITLLVQRADIDTAVAAQVWLHGSLQARTWAHVIPLTIADLILLPLSALLGRRAPLLEMGDETAAPLGVPPELSRLLLMGIGISLTALATAAAGPIAFVALAAPHLAARLTKAPGTPLLAGGICGALLLAAADLLARLLPSDWYLPVGVVTGILGGIYLLILLAQRKQP